MRAYTEFEKAVDRFLVEPGPGVLSIKGHWGVGKTYAWTKYLQKLKGRENDFVVLQQRTYSYCSLFGQQSISDIKATLFGSLEPVFGKRGRFKKFIRNASKGGLEAADGVGIPVLGGKLKGTDQLAKIILEQSIKNLVICFDDLDRKESSLTDSSFLGLVTGLRDSKNCKIVLLYNDDVVESEEDTNVVFKSFMEYREKVVDHEFAFRPTPEECFEIAFKGNDLGITLTAEDERSTAILSALRPLQLSNIRILKKVRNALEYFIDVLSPKYPKALSRHYGQITKLCGIYYRHGADLRLKDILSFTPYSLALANRKDEEDPEKKKLFDLLNGYKYHSMDFDRVTESFLKDGYIDISSHCTLLEDIEKRQHFSEIQEGHSAQWHKLYDNFSVPAEEYIEGQKAFLHKHYDEIDIFNMEAALRTINKVGGNIDVYNYMDKRLRSLISGVSSIRAIRDEAHRGSKELLDRCEEIYWEVRQPLPIDQVITLMTRDSGWNPEDSIDLEPLSEDDFYDYLTTSDDPELIRKVKKLRTRLPHDDKGKEILKKLDFALRRVAERSDIDELRVRNYISKELVPDSEEMKPLKEN